MNKPKGYVSATEDRADKTVLELVSERYKICMGNLELPESLKLGETREVTEDELKRIQERGC